MPESDFPPGAFLSLKIIFSAWKYAEMFSLNLQPQLSYQIVFGSSYVTTKLSQQKFLTLVNLGTLSTLVHCLLLAFYVCSVYPVISHQWIFTLQWPARVSRQSFYKNESVWRISNTARCCSHLWWCFIKGEWIHFTYLVTLRCITHCFITNGQFNITYSICWTDGPFKPWTYTPTD